MKTPRSRLSIDPVAAPVSTFATDLNSEYEGFVLEDAVEQVPFQHWTAHLRAFWGWHSEEPNYRCSATDFPELKALIARGLEEGGYSELAESVLRAANDLALNERLIRQYTGESGLYLTINRLLRTAHNGACLRGDPLVPWMLQFNCAMRLQPKYGGVAYRGSRMQTSEVEQYVSGFMFQWAAFVSASRDVDVAVAAKGNVIFEIAPWGSYNMFDKREPYDISVLSTFPDEREVVFPIACTYRVTGNRKDKHRTWIYLETVDQY